jgi:DHA1 family bicyclomycin/chloramphenicol resistance-like MFS transporter
VLDLGSGIYGFYFFVVWQASIFFQAGLTIGNLNALAMEPMGHIAGMAASVIGALSTVGAVMISGPIGTLLNPEVHTLTLTTLILSAAGFAAMLLMRRTGRTQAPA